MHSPRLFLAARILLCLLIACGFVIWFFVRAPEGTSAGAIFTDVQLTGRAHEVVHQTVGIVRKAVALRSEGSTEQLAPVRSQLLFFMGASSDLADEIGTVQSQWIPVNEAADLLDQCRDLCQLTLDRTTTSAASTPAGNAPTENLQEESVPDGDAASQVLAERPRETALVLQARAEQLLEQSSRLQKRVEQAIESGMFARGTLLGFSSSALLLACLTLSALLGLAVIWHASRRLQISPERLIEMELELIGQKDRTAALRGCHERVHSLLELADGFCRDGTG